jgi:hypothetical protein
MTMHRPSASHTSLSVKVCSLRGCLFHVLYSFILAREINAFLWKAMFRRACLSLLVLYYSGHNDSMCLRQSLWRDLQRRFLRILPPILASM